MQVDIDINHDSHTVKALKQARWYTRLWPSCLGPGCFCCKSQKHSLTFIGYDPVGKFQRAASMGDVASVERLIKSHQYSVNDCDRRGRTSLHYACAHNHPDVVALLLSKNASIDMRDDEGRTPLIKAIQFENVECVSVLLKQGADPHTMDFSGDTALHHAVSRGNTTIVSILLEYNADIEAKTQDGLTPYDLALFEEKHLMAQFLIQKGAKAHSVVDSNREASQKHSESMTNVFKMNEGVDEITELTTLSGDESSPKKPEDRKKKDVRFNKEVRDSSDSMPSCSGVRSPRDLKSILKLSDTIRTAHGRINEQSTVCLSEDDDISLPPTKDNNIISVKERLKQFSHRNKNSSVKKIDQTVPRESEMNLCSQEEPILDELSAHNLILFEKKYKVAQFLRKREAKREHSEVELNSLSEDDDIPQPTTKDKNSTSVIKERLKRLSHRNRSNSVKKMDQRVPIESEVNLCSREEPIPDELSAHNLILFEEKYKVAQFLRKKGTNDHSVVETNSDESSPKKSEQIKEKHVRFNKVLEVRHSSDPMPSCSEVRPTRELKPSLNMSDSISTAYGRLKEQSLVWLSRLSEDDDDVSESTTLQTFTTSVIKATRWDNMECISELLKQYVDPHMTDLSGNTALHDDVSRDKKTIDSKLLEKDVDIDAQEEEELSVHKLVLFEEKYWRAHFLRKKKVNVHSVVESNSDESSPKKSEQIKKKHVRFNKVLQVHHSSDPMPSCSVARHSRELKSILKKSNSISTAYGRLKEQSIVCDDSSPKKPEQIKKTHVKFNKDIHHSTVPMRSCSEVRPTRELKPSLNMSDSISTAYGRLKEQSIVWLSRLSEDDDVSESTTLETFTTSVIKATRWDNMECISELLKQYVDPHMTDLSGNTALHNDVSRDEKTIDSKLLEQDVDIDAQEEDKLTAHNLALFEEKHQDAHFLRKKGAVAHSVVEWNREPSQKHLELMTNVLQMNEGEDEIIEQTSLSRFSENPDVPASITEDKDSTSVTKGRLKRLLHRIKNRSIKKKDQTVTEESEMNPCSRGEPIPISSQEKSHIMVEEKKSEVFLHESYDHEIAMLQPTVPIETTPSECVGDRGDGVEASEKHDCDHDTTPELTPSSGDTLDSSMDVDPIVVPTNPNNHASHTRITYNAMCTMAGKIKLLVLACSVFCIIFLFIMMKRIEHQLWGENDPGAPSNQKDEHGAAQTDG